MDGFGVGNTAAAGWWLWFGCYADLCGRGSWFWFCGVDQGRVKELINISVAYESHQLSLFTHAVTWTQAHWLTSEILLFYFLI